MVEKRKENQKVSFSEEDACSLLQRYEPTTVLTLLQEVEHHADLKIDWSELVKKTSTGITNVREYQMLWRHLAYQDDLLEKLENGAQPLDDDSDIECELEAFPAPTNEALTEAEACVKVMIDSGIQSESNILNGSTIEAPLTINIPSGPRGSEILQPSCSTGGKNIIVPVTVQKFPLPPVPPVENIEANGLTGGNNISLRRKRKWSEEEDRQLMAAVKKWGEGNWAVIINKGEYDWGGRQSSHLSQRWATLRKKNSNLSIGKNSTGPKLTEAQMAARHAMSMALAMPVKTLKANGMPGQVSTKPVQSNTIVETSAGGNGPGHLSKEAYTMPNLSTAVKSQPTSKKTKFNLCLDSAVRATAVASGACVSSPLDAASLTQAAEATSSVHTVHTGGSSAKSLMPASGAAQSDTHPNQHCTYMSPTTTPVSSYTNSACIPAAPLGSPSKASSLAVETASSLVEVPKSEPKNEGIPVANKLPLKQEVKTIQGREIHDPDCAPKEQRRGDVFSRREDAEIKIIEETKAAPASLEAEHRSQEVVMNFASPDNNVLAAKVVAINDSKMLSAVKNTDGNMNEQNASLPSTIPDKSDAKQELPINVDVAKEI